MACQRKCGVIRCLLLVSVAIGPASAGADTLREALVRAYNTNPTLTAQRASQRANDENVPIARASGLPSVGATGSFTNAIATPAISSNNPNRALNGSVSLSVPLYQGGLVRNSVRAAEARVEAGREGLRSTEANLFTGVVGAYLDVIRDEAIVQLNGQNVRVLEVNLRASRDRFQVGDLTRTDVAQSEARLALARAQLQSAEARLIASRENYINIVGAPPQQLQDPPVLPNLPATTDAAVTAALDHNPDLLAAFREREATRFDVGAAKSARLPRLSAVASGDYANYLGSLGNGTGYSGPQGGAGASAGLSLSVPLFQGGRPGAQVRQAQALRSRAIENATATERAVIANARSAYASWRSSNQVIASAETAVSANRLSLEGVRAENSVGTRTILDILNAEQELLNSQVTLVSARRDAYLAGFALLAAMGDAEAQDLGLDGGPLYDPLKNYRRVRHSINDWASDGEPAAVATRTTDAPAQDATVSRPLDPALDSSVDRTPALTTGSQSPDRK